MISCSDFAPPARPARNASTSRLNSRATMLGGFGLGVPTALTVVVAPTPASAVTAAGYGAAVEFVTTIFLPASEGESAAA